MAIQWIESFDYYGTGATSQANMVLGNWAAVGGSASCSTTFTRTGLASLKFSGAIANANARRVFSGALTTVSVGAGLYFPGLPTTNGTNTPFQFQDAANAAQVSIVVQTTGAIAAYRGTGSGTLLGTSTTLMTAASWNHLEAKVVFSNTVGTVQVKLNGVTILNLSGLDTVNTANVESSQIIVGCLNTSAVDYYMDDLYCTDSTGARNTGLLGDCAVYTLYPDSDGSNEDWTLSAGTDSWDMINDAAQDGDTTYMEATAVNNKTDVNFQDLSASIVDILGLQMVTCMKKSDAGACSVKQTMLSSGTALDGTTFPITTAYTFWSSIFEVDPNTSTTWTRAGINAAQMRITRTV